MPLRRMSQPKSADFLSIAVRLLGFWLLWVVMVGTGAASLLVGIPAAAAAGWVSLQLIPPHRIGLRLLPALAFFAHFLKDAVVAGVEVAWLAFQPKMPLRPGFVSCPCHLPDGLKREGFSAVLSLLPGSLPCGWKDGVIELHCLDTEAPTARQVADVEARYRKLFVEWEES